MNANSLMLAVVSTACISGAAPADRGLADACADTTGAWSIHEVVDSSKGDCAAHPTERDVLIDVDADGTVTGSDGALRMLLNDAQQCFQVPLTDAVLYDTIAGPDTIQFDGETPSVCVQTGHITGTR